jgi:hypothetical protein
VRSQQRYTPRRIPLAGSGTASLRPLPSCRFGLPRSGLHIPKMRRREPSLPAVRRPSGGRPSSVCRASLSTGRSPTGQGLTCRAHLADGGWTDHQDLFSSSRRTRARPRTLSGTRIPTAEAAGSEPTTLPQSRSSTPSPPVLSQVGLLPARGGQHSVDVLDLWDLTRRRSAVLGRDPGLRTSPKTCPRVAPHPIARLRVRASSTIPVSTAPLARCSRPDPPGAWCPGWVHVARSTRTRQLTSPL